MILCKAHVDSLQSPYGGGTNMSSANIDDVSSQSTNNDLKR